MTKEHPSIAVIGGGTGTFTVLSGLRDKDVNLTAIMTMVDDGGSNKVLRDEFGLLPTSGIRQAMVALSEQQSLMRELFMYRYYQGKGIAGMTFGNLFLAAMSDILGSQEKAIEETSRILSVKGKILPISYDDVRLVATYEDGSEVLGEHHIDEPTHDGKMRIKALRTVPTATISEESKKAILESDMVVLGPGDLYTNTIANLIVEGTTDALEASNATVVFVMNLMTKYGETYNFTASDFLFDLSKYLPLPRIDVVILNNFIEISSERLALYEKEGSKPVEDDLAKVSIPSNIKVVREALVSKEVAASQKGDLLQRSVIRHDSEKLAKVLLRQLP